MQIREKLHKLSQKNLENVDGKDRQAENSIPPKLRLR